MDQTQKVATLVFGSSDVAIPLIAEPGSAGELVYKLHIPSIEKRFSLKYVELDGLLAVADSRGLTFTGYAPNARIQVAGEPLEGTALATPLSAPAASMQHTRLTLPLPHCFAHVLINLRLDPQRPRQVGTAGGSRVRHGRWEGSLL
jgi:hypothetical protein